MKYRCRGCNRFIAEIRTSNNMNLNGKSIILEGNKLIITCKCGEVNIINLKKYMKAEKGV